MTREIKAYYATSIQDGEGLTGTARRRDWKLSQTQCGDRVCWHQWVVRLGRFKQSGRLGRKKREKRSAVKTQKVPCEVELPFWRPKNREVKDIAT